MQAQLIKRSPHIFTHTPHTKSFENFPNQTSYFTFHTKRLSVYFSYKKAFVQSFSYWIGNKINNMLHIYVVSFVRSAIPQRLPTRQYGTSVFPWIQFFSCFSLTVASFPRHRRDMECLQPYTHIHRMRPKRESILS